MALHKIKKGLDLPIVGEPEQAIEDAPAVSRVAVLGADYVGMKPTMHVAEGDTVRRGQLLFEDKKTPGVRYTAPGAGTVVSVARGDRRAFQAVVIELDESEKAGVTGGAGVPMATFESFTGKDVGALDREQVKDLLLESGLWSALRRRPFSRVAFPDEVPHAVFVNAMDTQPLAPDPAVVLQGREDDFARGVQAVAKLTDGTTYVCSAAGSQVPVPEGAVAEQFRGPHPAGTAGLHIHTLDPVHREKVVWWIGYQDCIALGRLVATGVLNPERVVALAGPAVDRPRLLRTRLGASTEELAAGQLTDSEADYRRISGSVFSGRRAEGETLGFLGRYHQQISVIPEDRERAFLGWLAPGKDMFSTVNAYVSKLLPGKKFAFSTSTNGSPRAMVPIGMYERVMPLDLMPTALLRALVIGDLEKAEELGCLELDEEDLSLCTFVCPGKIDYGPHLRQVLTTIEKEG